MDGVAASERDCLGETYLENVRIESGHSAS